MDKDLMRINIEFLEETLYNESTYNNLKMQNLSEDGILAKVTNWAKETAPKVGNQMSDMYKKIKRVYLKMTANRKTFENFKKTRITRDIQAYNRLAQYLSSCRACKIAHYNANKAGSYAMYSIRAGHSGNRIAHLETIVNKDLRGDKFNRLKYETENFVRAVDPSIPEDQNLIKSFVQNLVAAAEKFERLVFSLLNSIKNLESGYNNVFKRLDRVKILPGVRTSRNNALIPFGSDIVKSRKKDNRKNLFLSCITVIAFANRQIVNISKSMVSKISSFVGRYENLTKINSNDNNENDDNVNNNENDF